MKIKTNKDLVVMISTIALSTVIILAQYYINKELSVFSSFNYPVLGR